MAYSQNGIYSENGICSGKGICLENGICLKNGICSKMAYVRQMAYKQKWNSKKAVSYPEIYARTSSNEIQSSHRSFENSFICEIIDSIFIEKLFPQTSIGKFQTPVMFAQPLVRHGPLTHGPWATVHWPMVRLVWSGLVQIIV